MDKGDLLRAIDPARFASDVRANRPADNRGHHVDGPIESVREDEYRGHRIVVRTTYEITVDGEPVVGHLAVGNDGRVHYHALPNYESVSAVDMVRRLIDAFPDDFEPPAGPIGEDDHDHEHEHGDAHDHGGHGQPEGSADDTGGGQGS